MKMKKKYKVIALALLCVAILCSFKYSNKEGDGDMRYTTEQMRTLYYKGHSYICYRTYAGVRGGCGLGASIIHDPDCKCGKGGAK